MNMAVDSGLEVPPPFMPVLERFTRESGSLFEPGVNLVPIAYQERPFSRLLRLAVRDSRSGLADRHVFVKLFKDKQLAEAGGMQGRVAQDFAVTHEIYEWMCRWPDLGTVRPLACYPEHLAIITEEAPGPSLLEYVNARAAWFPSATQVAQLEEVAGRVGRWLRAFQTFAPVGAAVSAEPLSLADLRDYVDVRLRRLVAGGHWITEPLRREILAHIDRVGATVPGELLIQVPIHADFALGNILVSGDRIVVLDFAMAKRGSLLHDLSRLYVQLELLTTKPQFRPSTVSVLRRGLMAGFGGGVSETNPLFRLLTLMHRVNHFATLSNARESLLARLFSHRVRQRHRRWIQLELSQHAHEGANV
jgi:hypothetical protein